MGRTLACKDSEHWLAAVGHYLVMDWIFLNNLLQGGALFCHGWDIGLYSVGALAYQVWTLPCSGLDFFIQQTQRL